MCLNEVYKTRNSVCPPSMDNSFPEWSPRMSPQKRSLQTWNWGGRVSLSRMCSGQREGPKASRKESRLNHLQSLMPRPW